MYFNYRIINRITGLFIFVFGLSLIPSMFIAAINDESAPFKAFIITSILSAAFGLFVFKAAKPADIANIKIMDGFFIAAACWLFASIAGMFPYLISGEITNPFDAFFESVSGFSTTGATILTGIENCAKSILFWRSFTQWIGGASILILTAALLPALGFSANIALTARFLFFMYSVFTAAGVILFLAGGLPPYEALLNTFSSVSTGGFSRYGSSAPLFDGAYIDLVFTLLMLSGAISFTLYYSAFRHGLRVFRQDSEFKLFIILILGSFAMVFVGLMMNGTFESDHEAAGYAAVQVISIATTTGYAAADFGAWPLLCKMALFFLMFVGACSTSVGGGIKAIRALYVFKLITRGIFVRLNPNAIVSVKLYDKAMEGKTLSRAASFVFLYIAAVFTGSILISLDNNGVINSVSSVVSSLGNIGPMFSETGQQIDYSVFSYPSKLLLAILMLLGRLEFFALTRKTDVS